MATVNFHLIRFVTTNQRRIFCPLNHRLGQKPVPIEPGTVVFSVLDMKIAHVGRCHVVKKVTAHRRFGMQILAIHFNNHMRLGHLGPSQRYPQPAVRRTQPAKADQDAASACLKQTAVQFGDLSGDLHALAKVKRLRIDKNDIMDVLVNTVADRPVAGAPKLLADFHFDLDRFLACHHRPDL